MSGAPRMVWSTNNCIHGRLERGLDLGLDGRPQVGRSIDKENVDGDGEQ